MEPDPKRIRILTNRLKRELKNEHPMHIMAALQTCMVHLIADYSPTPKAAAESLGSTVTDMSTYLIKCIQYKQQVEHEQSKDGN